MVDLVSVTANIQHIYLTTSSITNTFDLLVLSNRNPSKNIQNILSNSRHTEETLKLILKEFKTRGNEVSCSLDRVPALKSNLDSTAIGCLTIYTLFGRDLDGWGGRNHAYGTDSIDWREKEEMLEVYHLHMKALAQGLHWLSQCLRMKSSDEMKHILDRRIFLEVAQETTSLRMQHPELGLPASIFSGKFGEERQVESQRHDSVQVGIEDLNNATRNMSIASAQPVPGPSTATRDFGSPYIYGTTPPSGDIQAEGRRSSKPVMQPTISLDDEKIFLPPPPEDEKIMVMPTQDDRIVFSDVGRASIASASGSSYGSPFHLGRSPPSPFFQPLQHMSTASASPQVEIPPPIIADLTKEQLYFGFQPPKEASGVPPLDEDLAATLLQNMEAHTSSPDPRMALDWAEEALRYCRFREQWIERISKVQKLPNKELSDTEKVLKERAIDVVQLFAAQPFEDGGPAAAASARATFIQARWIETTPQRKRELLQESATYKRFARSYFWIGKMYEADAEKEKSKEKFEKAVENWEKGNDAGDPACRYKIAKLLMDGHPLIKYDKDEMRGLSLLNQSIQEADKDCPDALYYLAIRQLQGNSNPTKLQISLKKLHFHKSPSSSSLDTASAQSNAYHLLRQAARLGHSYSMLRLGLAHQSGFLTATLPNYFAGTTPPSSSDSRFKVGSDASLAMHYFQLASHRGLAEADYEIANSLVWGTGDWPGLKVTIPHALERTTTNTGGGFLSRTMSRRRKSSTVSPPSPVSPGIERQLSFEDEATLAKARMYAPQALMHSRLAAKAGVQNSYFLVGQVYEAGVQGWVEKNVKEASRWYLLGASRGDSLAREKADSMRQNLLDNRKLWEREKEKEK